MAPQDFLSVLRKRPFEPFTIQVSDGSSYHINHSELVMVGLRSIAVGVPAAGEGNPVYERVETVSLQHVVKLVPRDAEAAGKAN